MVVASHSGSLALTEQTVMQAAEGDQVAFARLVNACHGDMLRVAYVVAHDEHIAQDAVQAAWTTAWRKLRSLRDPGRARAWLVAVAANEARMLLRHERRHAVIEIRPDTPADRPSSASAAIDHVDLANALARLGERDRTLIALRYVAGLEPAEIAAQVGMSPSGVRGHMSRLLARLRTELGDA
jgi:RNA polymerase sigma-70 factor (ECF subfamily)